MLNSATRALLFVAFCWLWFESVRAESSAGWEGLFMSFSASTELPETGTVLRHQWLHDSDGSGVVFPDNPGLFGPNPPNAYHRLANGHQLLSFANVTPYPGAPRALFPGDVIEVDHEFSFQSLRLDALNAPGFSRSINVNAVSADPVNPDHLLISVAQSVSIDSFPFVPTDIIYYDGTGFFLAYDGLPLIGRNINAMDAHDAGAIRYYTVSFESGGSLAGISYSSSDILALAIEPAGQTWFAFDRPGNRHPEIRGRLKLQALGVAFSDAPDRTFRDRFRSPP